MISERGTPTYTKKNWMEGGVSRESMISWEVEGGSADEIRYSESRRGCHKDSAEDEILLLEERIHEVVASKTNNEGPREKHPDKIRRPRTMWN